MASACSNQPSSTDKTTSPAVAADSNHATQTMHSISDSLVDRIIETSASDFIRNQQPAPVDFKNIRLKYLKKANGEELYILCGQFVTNTHQEIPFAMIKNSDYEQWVGDNSLTYCQHSEDVAYTKNDLTKLLKDKFMSLKK